jgi:hypothetical protein
MSPPGMPLVRKRSEPFHVEQREGYPGRGTPAKEADKGAGSGARRDKKGLKRQPQRVMVATSGDKGDNDKDTGNSDEEHIPVVERDFKCQARQPVDHFEKLLEATCPNHTCHVRHKLKECTMMKNYMTSRTFARS